jgi:hypothetical protein
MKRRIGYISAAGTVMTGCGCGRGRYIKPNAKYRHELYSVWSGMKERCNNSNSSAYKYYGGRGIRVCERWLESFDNFFADMGKRPEGLSIGRINNDGNYEPGNCRWEKDNEQRFNKTTTMRVMFEGKIQTIDYISKKTGMRKKMLWKRIGELGWDAEKAAYTPIIPRGSNLNTHLRKGI